MRDVRVNLAVDNCFASKRWTQPRAWARAVRECGLNCVEISADNECDPLYTPPEYLSDWAAEARNACEAEGVRPVSLFSGHGTYSTTGLAHHDPRVRAHMREKWVKPFLATARELRATAGFFAHAFSLEELLSAQSYQASVHRLTNDISAIAEWYKKSYPGAQRFCVEQMYTPHQYPWTLESCANFLRESGALITLDVGHASGQHRFLRPDIDAIRAACAGEREVYLGTEAARKLCDGARLGEIAHGEAALRILDDVESHSYLFARAEDGDPYRWLEAFGAWSPIIHLQQTDGAHSSHLDFSRENEGLIRPERVLLALKSAMSAPRLPGAPEATDEITLTLELFYPTSAHPEEILLSVAASAAYWRKWIPRDGMPLSEVIL